jgi:hypothetical protein
MRRLTGSNVVDEIWKEADRCFGRPEVFKAWPMICRKWEHALWHWNDQFGPLNPDQRAYFIEVVGSCLRWAARKPAEQRYASYQASLMAKLNHEAIRSGFERRASASSADLSMLSEMQEVSG